MRPRITIVYNQPRTSRYDIFHKEKAVFGVLEAAEAVRRSLEELDHQVTLLPLVPPMEAARLKLMKLDTDIAFNLFEGFAGEPESEALVPEVLARRRLAFTGCRADILRWFLLFQFLSGGGQPTQSIRPGRHARCRLPPWQRPARNFLRARRRADDFHPRAPQVYLPLFQWV